MFLSDKAGAHLPFGQVDHDRSLKSFVLSSCTLITVSDPMNSACSPYYIQNVLLVPPRVMSAYVTFQHNKSALSQPGLG